MDPDEKATDMDAGRRMGVEGRGGRDQSVAVRVARRAALAVAVTGTIAVSSLGGVASAHAGSGSVSDESVPQADLSISTRSSTNGPYVDRSFDWLLSVTNNGSDVAESVVVSDVVPAAMTVIRASSNAFQCSTSANTVTCTRGELAAGVSGSIDIEVMLPPASTPATVENSAAVSSATADPNPANNAAGAAVQTVVVQVGVPDAVVPDAVVPGAVVPGAVVADVAVRTDVVVPDVVVPDVVVPGAADGAKPPVGDVSAVPNVHPTRATSPQASTQAISQSATPRPSTPSALPTTGSAAGASTMIALTLLLAGSALLLLRRRRFLAA